MGPLSDQEPHPTVTVSTFGDDPAVWKYDVLGTAAGDDGDWGVQPQTLLDAHGQEGQLGQVVPKEPPRQLSRELKQTHHQPSWCPIRSSLPRTKSQMDQISPNSLSHIHK